VEEGKLRTGVLQTFMDEATAAIPDLFARRAAWLADHRPVERGSE